jgi:hypothetical protein
VRAWRHDRGRREPAAGAADGVFSLTNSRVPRTLQSSATMRNHDARCASSSCGASRPQIERLDPVAIGIPAEVLKRLAKDATTLRCLYCGFVWFNGWDSHYEQPTYFGRLLRRPHDAAGIRARSVDSPYSPVVKVKPVNRHRRQRSPPRQVERFCRTFSVTRSPAKRSKPFAGSVPIVRSSELHPAGSDQTKCVEVRHDQKACVTADERSANRIQQRRSGPDS